MKTKEQIISKVKKYIIDVLEPARPELSGFAACPFVKTDRINNKIMYDVLDGETKLLDLVREFDSSCYTTAIFVQLLEEGEIIDSEEGLQYQRFVNALMKQNDLGKYKSICVNPEDKFEVDGFCPRAEAPYFLINIGLRKDFSKAHKALEKTKYFENFPEEYRKLLSGEKEKSC